MGAGRLKSRTYRNATLSSVALTGRVAVPPHPDADRMSCSLGSGANALNIVLDLPRIWWRLKDGRPDPGEWRDTPLVMTRDEFRAHAYANGTISLLSKRQASVRAGFGDEPDQRYSRTIATGSGRVGIVGGVVKAVSSSDAKSNEPASGRSLRIAKSDSADYAGRRPHLRGRRGGDREQALLQPAVRTGARAPGSARAPSPASSIATRAVDWRPPSSRTVG